MAQPISRMVSSIESLQAAELSGTVKVVEDVQKPSGRTRTRAEQVHPLAVEHTIGVERDVVFRPGASTQAPNLVSIRSEEDNERDSEPRCDVPVATLKPFRDDTLPSTPLSRPRLIAEEQQQAITTTLTQALNSVDALRLEIQSDATRARELGDQTRANAESARKQARRAWLEAERAAILRREFDAQTAVSRKANASVAAAGKRERAKLRTAPKRAKPTKKTRTTSIQTALVPSAGSPIPDDNRGLVAGQRLQDDLATKMDAATKTGNAASCATADASIQTDNAKCVFLVLPANNQLTEGVNRGQQTTPVRERQRSGIVEADLHKIGETAEGNEGAPGASSIGHDSAGGDRGECNEAQAHPAGMAVLKDAASQCEAVAPLVTTGDAATQSDATSFVSDAGREGRERPPKPYIPTVPPGEAEQPHALPRAQEADSKKPSFESAIFAHLITKKVRSCLSVQALRLVAKVREKRKKVKALLESTLRAKLRERNSKILELLRVSINSPAR